MLNIMLIILLILIILLTLVTLFFIFSPIPISLVVRRLFKGGAAVKPTHYAEIKRKTISYSDLSYHSHLKNGYLDIITPKNLSEKLPVIIWVHGGAFVAGDKSDVTEYAVQTASEGYIVVNMNYELAPRAKYPAPLLQVNEVYKYIKKHAHTYQIDLDQVYFAGDSSGAQIASQYVNIQVNANYSKMIGIDAIVPPESIKGTLFFCGLYDIAQLTNIADHYLINFSLKRIGWAYLGDKDWINSERVKEASTLKHVSAKFPSTFITDGNYYSFEEQGLALAKRLRKLNVFVSDVFYSDSEVNIEHGYQFVMTKPEAQHTFNEMIDFLRQTRNK